MTNVTNIDDHRPSNLTLHDYHEKAMEYMTDSVKEAQLDYGVLNTVAEAGELADKFAKTIRSGEPMDVVLIMSELGDILWSITCVADAYEIDLETVAELNLAKLKDREERGTIIGEGDER